ncbi:bifunctional serine/threonine-protein kinase/formylglycine-generating enzyme family protein [Simiduia sp. 21SJ11W-1]|uniref:bifunctional serine/threonine-protein kinase/formylglycine-generating enzyme family protein n=1 Tax=Simiduia sp. 21SJ11W-1 TaxID=2909669 RepID=UPI00209DC977|nr:bifunctional serine/threonine-protein kinase/formylglycine-generating enzyme family protein [Simiduia sp. 21SJ11W-1]UTA46613.1 bifunctional serine/threonine-protein kinase/formylglycine-generating enzyme family protein [Simiduia sp. 21SJ11W-1]
MQPIRSDATQESTKTLIKDRFELVNLLGSGGMGSVYRALDRRKVEANDSDPYLAVKLLNDDFKQHPDAFISLQRESRKSQNLAHPNIVTVFDFDRDADLVFMTMEYLDGTPLDKLIRQNAGKGLEKERADNILRDITSALMHAHSQRIVHSDFKPGNIFVTKKKGAKVFDFGIARAVSGGLAEASGEKTQFDAGTLGALTPAYASLEMLKGEEPSESDDVYALGCVAYELYAGRHPFNKVPADKAKAQRLKPKRLKSLTRRQWRALEGALAFERQERIQDAAEFMRLFFGRNRAAWLVAGIAAFFSVVLGVSFYFQYQEQRQVDQAYKAELEQKLQQELLVSRIADKKQAIDRLIQQAALSVDWERDLRGELKELAALGSNEAYIDEAQSRIASLFFTAAREYIAAGELENGERALTRADGWNTADAAQFIEIKRALASEKAKLEARLLAEQQAEIARIAAEERAKARAERERKMAIHNQQVEAIIGKLERQLRCGFGLNVTGDIAGTLSEMRTLDSKKAQKLEPIVASELASCFGRLARENPKRTAALLVQAQTLLPGQEALSRFKIDYCGHLEPGTGGRGLRYSCADPLPGGGSGPALVSVAGESRQVISMGRYEITWGDVRPWCSRSGVCGEGVKTASSAMPATGLPVEAINGYLAWLSQETGYRYRLPSYREWFGAASANGEREQPDRNCYLKYGGIEKGGELVAANAGSSNANGLINHVGNAAELVLDGNELLAVGGSFLDAMSSCLATTKQRFDARNNEEVGFRVVREAPRN